MTRQVKTPAQRAEEALGRADRAVKRYSSMVRALREEQEAVQDKLDAAIVRRDYLARNPDLPKPAPKVDG